MIWINLGQEHYLKRLRFINIKPLWTRYSIMIQLNHNNKWEIVITTITITLRGIYKCHPPPKKKKDTFLKVNDNHYSREIQLKQAIAPSVAIPIVITIPSKGKRNMMKMNNIRWSKTCNGKRWSYSLSFNFSQTMYSKMYNNRVAVSTMVRKREVTAMAIKRRGA